MNLDNFSQDSANFCVFFGTSLFHNIFSFFTSYICPVLVSLLAISATLAITISILNWNYLENNQRKLSKKQTILNHWGKHKPVQADLDKLYVGELDDLRQANIFSQLCL